MCGGRCNICNIPGHYLKDCPQKEKRDAAVRAARPPCEFYLKGSCHKGADCAFAHPEGLAAKKQVCRQNNCIAQHRALAQPYIAQPLFKTK